MVPVLKSIAIIFTQFMSSQAFAHRICRAVLRIFHELEHLPQHQFIWFLAPTVALCSQQFEYIQSQISSVQAKCLKGEDGVDRWTSQRDWDAVLKNVKIVVSTFQILLDALSHGFVQMESLALIIFDEGKFCYS